MSKKANLVECVGKKKNVSELCSSGTFTEKPPLPNNKKRRRKLSDNILTTVTNLSLPPIRKRRLQSMGSVCTKKSRVASSVSLPKQQSSVLSLRSSRVSPTPVDPQQQQQTVEHSKISLHGESHVTVRDQDQHPRIDILLEECEEKVEQEVSNPTTPTSFISLNEEIDMLRDKQTSLPDLRSKKKLKSGSRSRSHGDVQLKTSNASANLLGIDSQQVFTKRAPSTRYHSSENVLNFNKRKKRPPTLQNGIHVLEVDQVNYYHILEEIGRGSFGSVCKCLCHRDHSYYAMKIISKKRLMRKNRSLSRNPAKVRHPLEPLQREIAILKKMDHPNIVKLIEVIDDIQVDNVYMVFELMHYGVVIEVPTKDYIPEERSRKLFRDLLLGIEYLHYSKIIHRDIKPSNLLLDKNDHIKIADFGVSDMFEGEDDLLNKYAGSPAFQAPEVLDYEKRDRYSGKAVDVWAMGVTFFCFLYGKCPFFNANIGELYNLIKTEPLKCPDEPAVNPQAIDLLSRMLSKDPKTRITVLEIKNHPWVTEGGSTRLPTTEQHCSVIEVTDEEVKNSIKYISKLSSLVLAKSVLRGKSFVGNIRAKAEWKRNSLPISKIS